MTPAFIGYLKNKYAQTKRIIKQYAQPKIKEFSTKDD